MGIPNRAGTFNALPLKMGLDNTGPNDLATVTISFGLYEEAVGGEWVDVAPETMAITGYFYLEQKDGSLNKITVDNLKAALGWDGRDLGWFQEADLSEHPVQVVLVYEQYQGKDRLRVKYLNPHGYEGGNGVSQGDDSTVKSIVTRLGAKLRALSGGTPRSAAGPKTASPKSPPKPPKGSPRAPTKAPAAKPAECTADDAWAAFAEAGAALGLDEETVTNQWFETLAELFPSKQPEALTSADWGVMKAEGPQKVHLPL
ncbi:MAG: hypothetical protein JXL80_07660 [Planctomycetes bacterium]|nr:hypothetical protein [Planctomycetota bacterium]